MAYNGDRAGHTPPPASDTASRLAAVDIRVII